MTAIESVAQTLKQIEQYQTQLQQYENMLQNTMAPAAYIWDQAQSTINRLIAAHRTPWPITENQLGGLDALPGASSRTWPITVVRPASTVPAGCTPAEQRGNGCKTAAWRVKARKKPTTRYSRALSNSSAT
jgi:hypothetical protein